MNWELWRAEFKKYLPEDYVDEEIDRAIKNSQNKEVWADEREASRAYNSAFSNVLSALKKRMPIQWRLF